MGGQGERAGRVVPGIRQELTPRQWRIAARVVRGLTGYEVGAVGPLGVDAVEALISRSLAGAATGEGPTSSPAPATVILLPQR